MAEKDAKRLRLAGLVGLKGVSTSALAAIMKKLHEEPMEVMSERQLNNVIADTYAEVGHTIELPLSKGGCFGWKICRIDKLMAFYAKNSEAYRQMLIAAARASSDGHLNTIVYLDEVTPGNLLRLDNQRTFWSFYIGFREMPQSTTPREQYWLPLGVLRTYKAHEVLGGVSNVFRLLLRSILLAPANGDVGFAIQLEVPQLIKLRISNSLGDEAALKQVYSNKGAAGLRPCMLCRNIVSLGSDLLAGQSCLQDVSCSDPSLFGPATDDSIWQTYDTLKAKCHTLTKTTFATLEKASGLNFNRHGLLSDLELRRYVHPVSTFTMDWLHNFLCHGVATIEVTAFLELCRTEIGLSFRQLDTFVKSDWSWAKSQSVNVASVIDLFDPAKEKQDSEHQGRRC